MHDLLHAVVVVPAPPPPETGHRTRRLALGIAGWRAAGEDDVGPYHTPHEDGMIHLHDWIRREMGQRRTAG